MASKAARRFFLFLVFIGALLAISLVTAGFASDNWVLVRPERKVDNATQTAASQVNKDNLHGVINLGLFKGTKKLKGGLLTIEEVVDIMKEMRSDPPFWNVPLWICIIVFGCLALAWGLVTAGFALLNISRKPVETISGPLGLYLWNFMGILFCLLAIILFLVLFNTDIQENVLTPEERSRRWISKDRASLDWSFFLVVAAVIVFALNTVFVYLAGARLRCCRSGPREKVAMDGVMMY